MHYTGLVRAAFVAAFFISVPGWADEGLQQERYIFPETLIALEDGDVILTDSVSVSAMVVRKFGRPSGRYTHAGVFLNFPDGKGKIVAFNDHNGIKFSDPNQVLQQSFQVALLRPKNKPVSGTLRAALAQLSNRPLTFDYDMKWPNLESNTTYCVGFLSQLFRLSGPSEMDPFPKGNEVRQEFWSDWAQHNLSLSLDNIVSPNAALTHSGYTLVAEFQSPGNSLDYWIKESALDSVMHYLQYENLSFLPPRLGSHIALLIAKAGFIEDMNFVGMPEDRLKIFMNIREFSIQVETRTKRFISLNPDQEWNESAVRALTERVANYYRDDFFESVQ